jgi:hypothetical protein
MAGARKRPPETEDGPPKRKLLPLVGAVIVIGAVVTVLVVATQHTKRHKVIDGRVDAFLKAWNAGRIPEVQAMVKFKRQESTVGFDDLVGFIRKRRPGQTEPFQIELTSLRRYTFGPKRQKRARANFLLSSDKGKAERIVLKTIWILRGGYGWYIHSWGAKVEK